MSITTSLRIENLEQYHINQNPRLTKEKPKQQPQIIKQDKLLIIDDIKIKPNLGNKKIMVKCRPISSINTKKLNNLPFKPELFQNKKLFVTNINTNSVVNNNSKLFFAEKQIQTPNSNYLQDEDPSVEAREELTNGLINLRPIIIDTEVIYGPNLFNFKDPEIRKQALLVNTHFLEQISLPTKHSNVKARNINFPSSGFVKPKPVLLKNSLIQNTITKSINKKFPIKPHKRYDIDFNAIPIISNLNNRINLDFQKDNHLLKMLQYKKNYLKLKKINNQLRNTFY